MRFLPPLLVLLAATPEPGQGWLGIGLESGAGCIRALLVLPDGPAAKGGLREGECVTHVGSERVSSISDMQDAVAALRPGVATTLSLADGRTITVVPMRRSRAAESSFCRYRAKARPRVYVTLLEGDGGGEAVDGVFSVGELRRRFGAHGHARIIFGNSCSDGPSQFRMEQQPEENKIVPDDAQVQFGYDAPGPRHYVFWPGDAIDGGSATVDLGWACVLRDGGTVAWLPDGGQSCPMSTAPEE